MHILTNTYSEVRCTCGYKQLTTTGSESRRLAYLHAKKNAPSIVMNQCSQHCVDGFGMAEDADVSWHDILCPNHTVDCCASTLELPYGASTDESVRISHQHEFVFERINSI